MGHVSSERGSSRNIAALFLSEKGDGYIIDKKTSLDVFFSWKHGIHRIIDKTVELRTFISFLGGIVWPVILERKVFFYDKGYSEHTPGGTY